MKEIKVKYHFQGETKETTINQFEDLKEACTSLGVEKVKDIINKCFKQDQINLARRRWGELLRR